MLSKLSKNSEFYCKALRSISLSVFLLSIGLQVYFSNRSAIKSNEMLALNEQRDSLEEEITRLGQEITSISCLENIEKLAREQGFVDMEGSLLVVKSPAVAMAR